MATQIFVNLPVKDLGRSVEFFTKMGYTFDPRFTDENAACIVISDAIFVMLLVEKFFKNFTKKGLCDAAKGTEAIIALSAESRDAVDELSAKAFAAGAKFSRDPDDLGFMYSRSFEDLDGHLWEVFYMDMAGAEKAQKKW